MCTKPVARMTPAAKALVAIKKLESAFRSRQFLPTNRTATVVNPGKRMEVIATNLRSKKCFHPLHASNTGESLQLLFDS